MMRHYEEAKKAFLERFEKFEMIIEKDDGVFRHLRFRDPKEMHGWFNITTAPDMLVVRGDYGTYVFSRVYDMFNFFRGTGGTDPGYVASKAIAQPVEGARACSVFDQRKLKEQVAEAFGYYLDYEHYDKSEEVKEDYTEELYDFLDELDSWEALYEADGTEMCDSGFMFRCYDFSPEVLSYSYLWSYFAVVYGIERYFKNVEKQ